MDYNVLFLFVFLLDGMFICEQVQVVVVQYQNVVIEDDQGIYFCFVVCYKDDGSMIWCVWNFELGGEDIMNCYIWDYGVCKMK